MEVTSRLTREWGAEADTHTWTPLLTVKQAVGPASQCVRVGKCVSDSGTPVSATFPWLMPSDEARGWKGRCWWGRWTSP